MKKVIGLAVVAAAALSVSACQSKPADNTATEANVIDENVSDTLPADETTGNDAAVGNTISDNSASIEDVAENATAH